MSLDLCVWHQSSSIVEGNKMYESCLIKCDGYNTKCLVYQPRGEHFKNKYYKIKKQNEEQNNGGLKK